MAKQTIMDEEEIAEMQQKIDKGIQLAQKRLIERAKHNNTTLVIARNNEVVEVKADELLVHLLFLSVRTSNNYVQYDKGDDGRAQYPSHQSSYINRKEHIYPPTHR